MKSLASAVASIPVKSAWSSAVLPLPCMLRTSGTLLEPLYALGTCTITMRLCPPIVSVRVLEPATAFPQPSAALPEADVSRLLDALRRLRSSGIGIIYVTHRLDEIFRIADRVTVLRDGQTVGTREAASTSPGELIRMMVGRELNLAGGPRQRASGNSSSPKCPACESPEGRAGAFTTSAGVSCVSIV